MEKTFRRREERDGGEKVLQFGKRLTFLERFCNDRFLILSSAERSFGVDGRPERGSATEDVGMCFGRMSQIMKEVGVEARGAFWGRERARANGFSQHTL